MAPPASLRPCQPWHPPTVAGYRPAPAPGLLQPLSEVEPLVRPLRESTVAFDQYGPRPQGPDDTFDQYGIQPFTAEMPLLTGMPLGLASRLHEPFCPPRRVSRLRVQFRASQSRFAPPSSFLRLRTGTGAEVGRERQTLPASRKRAASVFGTVLQQLVIFQCTYPPDRPGDRPPRVSVPFPDISTPRRARRRRRRRRWRRRRRRRRRKRRLTRSQPRRRPAAGPLGCRDGPHPPHPCSGRSPASVLGT